MRKAKGLLARIAALYSTDNRRHARLRAEFPAALSGPFGCIRATGRDVTKSGAGVLSPNPLPVGTLLFFRMTTLGLGTFAHVCHCSAEGEKYRLGLKYREGLTRAPGETVGDDWTVERFARAAVPVWDEAEL